MGGCFSVSPCSEWLCHCRCTYNIVRATFLSSRPVVSTCNIWAVTQCQLRHICWCWTGQLQQLLAVHLTVTTTVYYWFTLRHYLLGDCRPWGWLVHSQRWGRPGLKEQPNACISPMCAIVSVYGWCAMLPWASPEQVCSVFFEAPCCTVYFIVSSTAFSFTDR